jgi:hypothetical protein
LTALGSVAGGGFFYALFGLKMDLKILKPAQFIAVYDGFMRV